jgi:dTDP-4-amino-4,6-dideoxygalactose transaminase
MAVPFVDLARTQAVLADELRDAFERVTASTQYTLGPELEAFEAEFADYCGTAHCVGTSDGTEALRIALLALGVEPGQEVIAPAMTYIATIEAIDAAGAKPVLVDVGDDRCISVDAAERARTPETAAIVPVHLYGRPADMRRVDELAVRVGIRVLEDACQAHGAELGGRRCGALGHAAAFSFYPSKNLGALGDGGAITTQDEQVAQIARSLRMHGTIPGQQNRHVLRGGDTGRLDALQAAFLRVKLPHLDTWNAERRFAADLYREALAELPLELPPADATDARQVFHLFEIVLDEGYDRDAVLAGLRGQGVGAAVHYPVAPHLQPALAYLGHARGDFPNAERIAARAISLPMFPGISEDEVEQVASALRTTLEDQANANRTTTST